MNIQQMHIEVDLSLQKINSAVKRNFEPEEIDWILNKQILRFIKSKIKRDDSQKEGGFQFDEIDLNALRTLIVQDKVLPVYKNSVSERFVRTELPGNYAYLIKSSSGIVRDCNEGYDLASSFLTSDEFIYILPINRTAKTTEPFYQDVSLTIENVDLIPNSAFPTGLQDPDLLFTIQDVVQNYLLNKDARVYWERYKDVYEEQSLILVAPTTISSIVYNVDGEENIATSVSRNPFLPQSTTESDIRSNRLPKTSLVEEFMDSAFAKSKWISPISAIEGNTLKIYHDNKFIINKVWVNYIRKPQLVSLSLNKSCDLPSEFHNDICDWAVEYIKQAIGDPNYQWKVQDNNTRRE